MACSGSGVEAFFIERPMGEQCLAKRAAFNRTGDGELVIRTETFDSIFRADDPSVL